MNMQSRNAQSNGRSVAMNKHKLLANIREVDFAILETVEFLDAHPNNLKALRYYGKLKTEREALVKEYEEHVGPLTMFGNENNNKWDWVQGPWPWEGDR